MTDPPTQRANRCSASPSDSSLGQRFAGLAVTGREQNSQTQHTNASHSQAVTSLKNQPTRATKPHQKQTPLRSNIHETPSRNRGPAPASSQLRRNVTEAGSSAERLELDWLPSINRGDSKFSMRIISELSMAPNSEFRHKTQNFLHDIASYHNDEVPRGYPRMRSRELGDDESPRCWEITPLEIGIGPPKSGSPSELFSIPGELKRPANSESS